MTGSTLAAVITRAWERHVLLNLTLELTYACELSCQFCYNDRQKRGSMLTWPTYRALLSDARELGCLYLTLTGGEPTRSRYFFEIGRFARARGFCIRVKTHGAYRNQALIGRIRDELDPMALDVSIHGAREATHDRLTGDPGSYDRLLGNLESMKRAGLRVTLRCPVTRLNEGEIEEIARLADELEYPVVFDADISPRDNGDRSPLKLAPSPEGIQRLYRFLAQQAPRRANLPDEDIAAERPPVSRYICGAGTGALTVDPYGEVLPCVAWRIPIGNLGESNLREIWNSNFRLDQVRQTNRRAGGIYGNGDRTAGLPFCPGRAQQETGSATSLSPALVQLASLYEVAKEGKN